MPVRAEGKKIINVHTGKIEATAKSAKAAKISAGIRNAAYRKKHGKK